MKVTINQEECISCAVCHSDCPDVFEEDEAGGATQIVAKYQVNGNAAVGLVPEELRECVQTAADDCPNEAIHIEG